MTDNLQAAPNPPAAQTGGARIFALIGAYLILAVAVGVARAELRDAGPPQATATATGAAPAR